MSNPVDAIESAFLRCEVLSRILAQAKNRVLSNPTDQFAISLGITMRGERRQEATKKIDQVFEQLDGLLVHLTLLDITASFELAFRERLKNAVGEARKAVRENYSLSALSIVRESLVHEVEHYQGIGGIQTLLGPHVDEALLAKLQIIRQNRNQFTHGTAVEVLPTVQIADALQALREIAALM